MVAAAGVSFLRVIVVALVLPSDDFAVYAATVALGSFLAYILSFGLIESTIKKFPRLFLQQQYAEINSISKDILYSLIRRALVYIFLALPFFLVWDNGTPEQIILGILLAFSNATANLVSSIQRAFYNINHFSLGSIVRSSITFLLVVSAAYFFSIVGVIIIEAISILLGSFVSRLIATFTLSKTETKKIQSIKTDESKEKGKLVFFSFIFLSIPFYLDRMFINEFYSKGEASAYAFMAILITGSAVLVNIIAQKVGPEVLKLEKNGVLISKQVLYAVKWSLMPVLIWILVISLALIILDLNAFPGILIKYNVSMNLVLSIGLLGLFQITSIFEFVFIANNREWEFFVSSLLYTISVIAIATYCGLNGIPIYVLILCVGLARAVYLLFIILHNLLAKKIVTDSNLHENV